MAELNLFHHHLHNCPDNDKSTYTKVNEYDKYTKYNIDTLIDDVTNPTKWNKKKLPPSHSVPDVFYEFHTTDNIIRHDDELRSTNDKCHVLSAIYTDVVTGRSSIHPEKNNPCENMSATPVLDNGVVA